MSLSYQQLDCVAVKDPRIMINNKRDYAILEGGKQVMYKAYTSTSISQSSIQFSCPPPSGGVIVDRKQYLTLPVRLTFTGPGGNSTNLLQPGRDAPRQFPLSKSIDTLQVTINNTAVSINMADVIDALLHYNTDLKLKEYDYSLTPTCPDQSQNYSDLYGTNRNPLSFYGDSTDEGVMARGGFQFNVVSNTPTLAVVDMVITEPLFLSPFYWGHDNSSGFANVNTMDFNISFLNNLGNRMWSHDNSLGTNVISSITTQFNGFSSPCFSYPGQVQPFMLFTYISPQDTETISPSMSITYPYFDITRFPTDIGTLAYSDSSIGNGVSYSSNNIQLSTIPRRIYVYVRPNNMTLYNTSTLTDSYYGISNINIQFNNQTGILSSASQQQLYKVCIKNHCNMNWTQWSGGPTYFTGELGTPGAGPNVLGNEKYGTMGSVFCAEFGTDIPLDSAIAAPGLQGQYNLLVQANVYNCDPTGDHNSIPLTMYIVVVNEGSFTIAGLGKSIVQLGVISQTDVLNAKQSPFINYKTIQEVNGGNFLSGLKDFSKNLFNGIKEALPYVKEAINIGKEVAPLFGLGDIDMDDANMRDVDMGEMRRRYRGQGVVVGGSPMGGRQMSRSELSKRLRSELSKRSREY